MSDLTNRYSVLRKTGKVPSQRNGRLIRPTSGNLIDCAIPNSGVQSRVIAKRLLKNDAFPVKGYTNPGTVVSVNRRGSNVSFSVRHPSGKTFRKTLDARTKVLIVETPAQRKARRDASRRS